MTLFDTGFYATTTEHSMTPHSHKTLFSWGKVMGKY